MLYIVPPLPMFEICRRSRYPTNPLGFFKLLKPHNSVLSVSKFNKHSEQKEVSLNIYIYFQVYI